MKKLFFTFYLFATVSFALFAQSEKLSEEGSQHWYKAKAFMDNIKQESDYFLILDEFRKVTVTDPAYAATYSNMGILWTSMGDLGGGIPCYDSAKVCYDKYLALRPDEKNTVLKSTLTLEAKREIFMKNIGLDNMIFIESGTPRKISVGDGSITICKNAAYVDAFYIKRDLFSIADYKNLITPMAIAVASSLKGKTFNIPYQQSAAGNDNAPYILHSNTAEQIIELLNCITGKNFFILTRNHYKMMLFANYAPFLNSGNKEIENKEIENFLIENNFPKAQKDMAFALIANGKKKLHLKEKDYKNNENALYTRWSRYMDNDGRLVGTAELIFFTEKNKYISRVGADSYYQTEYAVYQAFRLALPATEK